MIFPTVFRVLVTGMFLFMLAQTVLIIRHYYAVARAGRARLRANHVWLIGVAHVIACSGLLTASLERFGRPLSWYIVFNVVVLSMSILALYLIHSDLRTKRPL